MYSRDLLPTCWNISLFDDSHYLMYLILKDNTYIIKLRVCVYKNSSFVKYENPNVWDLYDVHRNCLCEQHVATKHATCDKLWSHYHTCPPTYNTTPPIYHWCMDVMFMERAKRQKRCHGRHGPYDNTFSCYWKAYALMCHAPTQDMPNYIDYSE